eukprot:gene6747-3420_t
MGPAIANILAQSLPLATGTASKLDLAPLNRSSLAFKLPSGFGSASLAGLGIHAPTRTTTSSTSEVSPKRKSHAKVKPMKEPHFFDVPAMGRNGSRGIADLVRGGGVEDYLMLMGHNPSLRPSKENVYIDGTPDYLLIPSAACRLRAAVPHAKLIVLLKDPVMRALSGWNMAKHKESVGLTPARANILMSGFAAEVAEEASLLRSKNCSFESPAPPPHKLKTELRSQIRNSSAPVACPHVGKGILRRGMYAAQLAWWLTLFPEEQLHIISYKELTTQPSTTMTKLFTYLGLDPSQWTPPPSDIGALKLVLDQLYTFYKPHNEQLYTLLSHLGHDNFPRFPDNAQ